MENQKNDFLNGPILSPLLRFAGPVLLALFLQAMYGAVDLIVVGKFAGTADISAVSTGSQAMQLVTSLLVGLTTGVTVLLGQKIGEGRPDEAGNVVGSAICLFVCVALMSSFQSSPVSGFKTRICSGRMSCVTVRVSFFTEMFSPAIRSVF